MKTLLKIIIVLIFLSFPICVYGDDLKIADSFDLSNIEDTVEDRADISFTSLIETILQGGDVIDLLKGDIKSLAFNQIDKTKNYVKIIIVIGIISALINIMSKDIKDKSVAELISLIGQVVILGIASVSFKNSIDVLKINIGNIVDIINSIIPLIITIITLGGTGATGGGSILLLGTEVVSWGINGIIVPLMIMGIILKIVNLISNKDILSKLSDLLIRGTSYALKFFAYAFTFLIGIERLSAGAISKSAGGLIKSLVKMVPVIGDIVGGTGEIALAAIYSIGNALGIAVIIVIIIACSIPLLEIGITALTYRILAAVLEPICDKTTIEVIDTIGEANLKVLSSLFIVNAMFVISSAILLCGMG